MVGYQDKHTEESVSTIPSSDKPTRACFISCPSLRKKGEKGKFGWECSACDDRKTHPGNNACWKEVLQSVAHQRKESNLS